MGGPENDSNLTSTRGCVHQSSNQEFDQISWVIAITLAILAAISNNLGVNLQKLAWTKKQNNIKQSSYRVVWLFGMAGIILASVFDFVALAFGPQSVIAPLGSLTMVMNGCVAPMMHGEKIRKKIIWTTFVIVAGCAMAVATASHENVICNLDGIFGYFRSLTFLGYALVILFITTVVALMIRKAERILNLYGEESPQYDRIFKYHRVSYAFIAGLYGAQSVVFARAIGQLVMSSTRGEQLFLLRYETYLILLGLIASIVVQMVYLNKGLARFESTYNVPVFTGTFIVGTAVSGGVVYGEFNGFTQLQATLFPLGVCLCVLGVFALAWTNDEESGDVEDDEENPSELPGLPALPPAPLPPGTSAATLSAAATAPSSAVVVRNENITPRSSLRLASGGFTPFVIGVSPEEPPHLIRKSVRRASSPSHHSHHHHHHHGRDLLTGLRSDERTPSGHSHDSGRAGRGSGVFFPRQGSEEFFTGTANSRGGPFPHEDRGSKPNTPKNSSLSSSLVEEPVATARKARTPRNSALDMHEHELRRPIAATMPSGSSAGGEMDLRRPLTPSKKSAPKPPE